MKTVIAAFYDRTNADNAASQLRTTGTNARHIRLIDSGAGSDLPGTLRTLNVPDERAHVYAEIVRRGATLVVASIDDDRADEIAAQLDRLGSIDVDASAARWREAGWQRYEADAPALDADLLARERKDLERESLAVVQEEVAVGKREVAKGGIRVRTFVTERPVHEQVELRDEHINVERQATNEPLATEAADAAFTEDEFVVTAKGEEAVVGKQARVVERVRVDKEADVHTETIEETERRRDVEVERVEAPPTPPTTPAGRR